RAEEPVEEPLDQGGEGQVCVRGAGFGHGRLRRGALLPGTVEKGSRDLASATFLIAARRCLRDRPASIRSDADSFSANGSSLLGEGQISRVHPARSEPGVGASTGVG
ncbi:MAG: hypothetical protein ACE37J_00470, partial [Pikeienuella sp.]|uniref:hypothetical protein n=1 Tax=Pikeienuella sp. TaxID=2831957 RepID=UPI00391DA88C